METVNICINSKEEFDKAVHGSNSLQSGDDLSIITKDGAMESGRAGAVITFSCFVHNEQYRAQYSVSVRHLKMILAALTGAYDDEGMPRERV